MKKILTFITVFIFVFLIGFKVANAGVCDGKKINNGYCNDSVTYTKLDKSYYDVYFLPVGFDIDENDGVGFCLDPALKSPDTTYKYVRELNLSSKFDKGVYSMYQLLIDAYTYDINNKSQYDFDTRLRSTFEAALRAWVYVNGNGIFTNTGIFTNEVNFYAKDANLFQNCVNEYILEKTDFSPLTDVKKDYKVTTNCFGNEDDSLLLVKKFFDKAKNVSFTWTNPYENGGNISKNISSTVDGYKIIFNIKEIDKFFLYELYNRGISQLGLEDAYLKAYVKVGGIDCSTSACNVKSISNNSKTGASANLTGNTVNGELTFEIDMTKEQYNALLSSGDSSISLVYEYQHPMNYENLYIARNQLDNTSDMTQRMLSITNYVHKDSIILNIGSEKKSCDISTTESGTNVITDMSGNNVDSIEKALDSGCCDYIDVSKLNSAQLSIYQSKCNTKSCKHEIDINGNNLFYNSDGNVTDISGFISDCSCGLININYLDQDKKTLYEKKCLSEIKYSVSGGLKTCSLNSPNKENYRISYNEEQNINSYCKLSCTEDLFLNDFEGKFKDIKAGMYFELNFPSTVSKKKCEIMINYDSWNKDYESALKDAVSVYNDYAYKSSQDQSSYTETCNCSTNPETGIETCSPCRYYVVSYGYTPILISDNTLSYGSYKSGSSTYYSNQQSRINSEVAEASKALQASMSNLVSIFNKYKQCGSYLKNYSLGTYNESITIKYEQDLYSDGLGVLNKSYEKSFEPNIVSSDPNINTFEETFSTLSIGGIGTEKVVFYREINSNSKSSYNSFGNTFTSSYFGEFYDSSKANSLLLNSGNKFVINVDATATKKANNNYTFIYTKLGYDNDIYNYFLSKKEITSVDGVNRVSSLDDLKRSCTYGTVNDLLCIPNTEDLVCGTNGKVSTKILFKIVDSDNIDPNGRITDEDKTNGYKNWENKLDVLISLQDEDTFNPENIEYSFDLDSAAIKKIREYNDTLDSYGDYTGYECDSNGNFCKSSFITTVTNGGYLNSYNFDKPFAKIVTGRKEWMVYFPEYTDTSNVGDGILAGNIYKVNLNENYKYTLVD